MTKQEQADIMSSLKTIVVLAAESTFDHRTLAKHTLILVKVLNQLFVKEGLEEVKFGSQELGVGK